MTATYPLPRQTRKSAVLSGDGASVAFGPFDFDIFDPADVEVWHKPAGASVFARTEAVTVAKTTADALAPFTVTFDAAPAADTEFVVFGARVHERASDVTRGGTLDSRALELELSRIGAIVQELRRDFDRAYKADGGGAGGLVATLPAGELPVFDAAGNIVSGGSLSAVTMARDEAVAARDATLVAFDSFDDRYLGAFAADPATDNDGNPLVAGTLYFNSAGSGMRVYTGSNWVAAYVSGDGLLAAVNNLSDLQDPAQARPNLGLGPASTPQFNGVHVGHASDTLIARAAAGAISVAGVELLSVAGGTMTGGLDLAGEALQRPLLSDYRDAVNALGGLGGGTVTIDVSVAPVVTATVDTGATTIGFSGWPPAGTLGAVTVELTNGGAQTVSWDGAVGWDSAGAPALTAAGVDVLTFYSRDGGTTVRAFAAGLGFA